MSRLAASAFESPCEPVTDLSPLREARILVVEPEPDRAMVAGACLARAGAQATVVRSLSAARRELGTGRSFDAALVDLGCDSADVSRLVARLRLASTPCLAVVLAPLLSAEVRQELLLRGAFEVLHRPVPREGLLTAAERAVRGTVQLRSNTARQARVPPHAGPLESPARRAKFELRGAVSAMTETAQLTPRESGVLRFIAMGCRYAEIAEELSISVRTVKMHSANIRRKSGARDRYDLLRLLLERQG